jgi:methionyl aminopeptidase
LIILKSPREIALMRQAGQVVSRAIAAGAAQIRPGVSTREIDRAVEGMIADCGATPLFKGVRGKVPFPAASCISVNEEVVHGIPGDHTLRAGDIVSIDTGCRLAGWCADSAWTFAVEDVDDLKKRLLKTGRRVLELAITQFGRKKHWSEVAALMAGEVRRAGFSVVEELVGHGIGREMHEDPQVPNYVSPALARADFNLEPGLVLAIEPMISGGAKFTQTSRKDYWTVITKDRSPSVHFEHTVALTKEGPLVLTQNEPD